MSDTAYRRKTVLPSSYERELASKLKQRQSTFERIRAPYNLIYDDIDDFFTGRRAGYKWNQQQDPSQNLEERKGARIYDQTAAMALQDFVDGYQGSTAAPTIDWWRPHFRNKQAMGTSEAKKWMDDVYEACSLEINNSNLYAMLNEASLDRFTYGYSTFYGPEWDAKKERLVYLVRHPREVYFAVNSLGDIDIVHRKFPITGRQILSDYPDAKITQAQRKAMEKNPYVEYPCIHAVYPREERDVTKITADNKLFASVYVLEEGSVILQESGYDEMPITLSRCRITGDPYPRSPAIDSIFSVMMLNQESRSVLRASQLLVEPPFIVTGTLKSKLHIVPNGITYKDSPADNLEPIPFPAQMQAAFAEIKDGREAVSKMFKAQIFSLMQNMPGKMNIPQVAAIQGEQAVLLQPIITNDQNENLTPLLRKTFVVLQKAGRIPPPPPSLYQYARTPVDIGYYGPVAMLAKKHLQMTGVNAVLPEILQLAKEAPQFGPMLDRIDVDALYDYITDSASMPAKLSKDMKLVQQIRQQRAQQMQQQQKLDAMNQGADALSKGSKAPEKGSPSAALMGGQQ